MPAALLREIPLAPPADLGPYRRADYEALPDEPRCELILGRLYVTPSPNTRHQMVAALLWRLFDDIAAASGGVAFVAPLDVALADHSVVQPDILYVTRARREILAERIEGAPDLVVEVLSPGSVRRDRGEKLGLYATVGIKEFWIVDPAERQIEHLVNDGGRFVVALPIEGEYRSPVLPEIRLDVAAFWRRVDERLPR